MYVTTSVPEDISRRVHVGVSAKAVFDALPGQTFTGPITQVNPAADPSSRQFTIRLTLSNPGNIIKPGLFARVTIETQRTHNAVVVPREAVKPGKNKIQTVIVVDAQSVAHVRPVQTGDSDAAGIQITQGVQAGETVVTLSGAPVKDGQKVAVAAANQAGGSGPVTSGGGSAQGDGSGQSNSSQSSSSFGGGGPNAPTNGNGGGSVGDSTNSSGSQLNNGGASGSGSANGAGASSGAGANGSNAPAGGGSNTSNASGAAGNPATQSGGNGAATGVPGLPGAGNNGTGAMGNGGSGNGSASGGTSGAATGGGSAGAGTGSSSGAGGR